MDTSRHLLARTRYSCPFNFTFISAKSNKFHRRRFVLSHGVSLVTTTIFLYKFLCILLKKYEFYSLPNGRDDSISP